MLCSELYNACITAQSSILSLSLLTTSTRLVVGLETPQLNKALMETIALFSIYVDFHLREKLIVGAQLQLMALISY